MSSKHTPGEKVELVTYAGDIAHHLNAQSNEATTHTNELLTKQLIKNRH